MAKKGEKTKRVEKGKGERELKILKLDIERESLALKIFNNNFNHYISWVSNLVAIALSAILFFLGLFFAIEESQEIFLRIIFILGFFLIILLVILAAILILGSRRFHILKSGIEDKYESIIRKL
jgi:amino acid transporter